MPVIHHSHQFEGGDWIGHYNQTTKQYDSINTTNIAHSLKVVQVLVDLHKDDPVVIGLEPRKFIKNYSTDFCGLISLVLLSYYCRGLISILHVLRASQ
jgi:hypothetical protein